GDAAAAADRDRVAVGAGAGRVPVRAAFVGDRIAGRDAVGRHQAQIEIAGGVDGGPIEVGARVLVGGEQVVGGCVGEGRCIGGHPRVEDARGRARCEIDAVLGGADVHVGVDVFVSVRVGAHLLADDHPRAVAGDVELGDAGAGEDRAVLVGGDDLGGA